MAKATKKAAKKAVKNVVKKSAPKKAVKKSSPAKKAAPVKKAVVAKKVAPKKAVKKIAKKAAPSKRAAARKPEAPQIARNTMVNPYLTFAGNCEQAFNLYRSVFGGNFGYTGRYKDMPPMEGMPPLPESEREKIMHISLPISKETTLMGADSSDAFGHATVVGNNFSISVNAISEAAADKMFAALSSGGHIAMPLAKTFWGSYFGMCTDKFGIQWMISYDQNPM